MLGDYYLGDLVDNKYCGHGTYVWTSGIAYTGAWENNLYQGEFRFNQRRFNSQGHGKYNNNSGEVFEGEFERGRPKYGKSTFTSGEIFEGPKIEWEFDGEGFRTVNGVRRRALFKKNKFVKYCD